MKNKQTINLICSRCQKPAHLLAWRCAACGGSVNIAQLPLFDAEAIEKNKWNMQRYAAMLPVQSTISLGEGGTPLVETTLDGSPIWTKLEYISPTSSYKDRGSVTVINHMFEQGVKTIVEDSSGNAGVSIAAYASKAGIKAKIFVPNHAVAGKKRQIKAFGADLIGVPGKRAKATEACIAAQSQAVIYASHVWSPFFQAGQMTLAWEVWEQLNYHMPAAIVCATGQGNLLLGFWHGCQALYQAGLLKTMPKIYAIQAKACAPIVEAWQANKETVSPVIEHETMAEGIRIASPVRGAEVLAIVRQSGGAAFAVDEAEILAARTKLTQQGLFVEPTSATPIAALDKVYAHIGHKAELLVPLTGSGLKSI